MKKFITLALGLAVVAALAPIAQAAPHGLGVNIITPTGTVYTITEENGQTVRRPYTSSGAFLSYSFNSWESIVGASAEDLALPEGTFIPPQDGKVICSDRGGDKGTCYLVTNGQKAGFTSADVFTKLGYDFKNVSHGDVSFLPSAPHIEKSDQTHKPGTLVSKEGKVILICEKNAVPLPSTDVLDSWGYSNKDIVPATSADKALPETGSLEKREAKHLTPTHYCGPVPPYYPIYLTKLNPNYGPVGTKVTVYGYGFVPDSYVYFGGLPVADDANVANDGKSLTFTVPAGYTPECYYEKPACLMPSTLIAPGQYLVTVVNSKGKSNSLAFQVTSISDNKMQIYSPSGGEKWALGSTQTIKWQAMSSVAAVNIFITSVWSCPPGPNCATVMPLPRIIAAKVPNTGSYNWTIPTAYAPCVSDLQGATPCSQIIEGEYTLTVSDAGQSGMSSESKPFSLVSSDFGGNQSPVIKSVSGPTSLAIKQTGTWTINAYDPDGSYLTYSVDWGDYKGVGSGVAVPIPAPVPPTQTGTFTHSYSQAGIYKIVFTVSDSLGATAQSTLTVNVGGATSNTPPKIVSSSPLPTNAQAGQSENFIWTATDADNDNLAWTVNWGDGNIMAAACPATASNTTFSANHAWKTAGYYIVYVTVGDCKSGSDTTTFGLTVGQGPSTPLPNFSVEQTLDITSKLANATNAIEVSQQALVTFGVKNSGGAAATMPNFKISYEQTASPVSVNTNVYQNTCNGLPQLASNQTCVYAFQVMYNQTTYLNYNSIRLDIDPNSSIAESSESDNWGVINFDVRSQPVLPKLISLSQTSGPVGAKIDITGLDMMLTGQTTTVRFGNTVASFPFGSGTTIFGVVVPNLPAGIYPVTVQAGLNTSNPINFTIN